MVKPDSRGQKEQQKPLMLCVYFVLLRSRMGSPITILITHYFPTSITFANFEAQKMLCSADMSVIAKYCVINHESKTSVGKVSQQF